MNYTDAFLQVLDRLVTKKLSDDTVHQLERCMMDYVGVTYAGRRSIGDKIDTIAQLGGAGECSVIGTGSKRDLLTASMMNGIAAHAIEMDDGHRIGAPHLEAVIVSAMIGIAQKERLSFERFARGVLIGYEATIRLSSAMQPSLKQKGFHATGICGTIGVACAVGHTIGLSGEQMKGALSAAATSAGGILQVLDDDSELKPYNVANAIQSGITAAYMGRCGFKGPQDVLGGRRGYLQAYSDGLDAELLLGETGSPAIFQVYVKPYASCRHSHPAIECALRIRSKYQLNIGDIEDVEVQTYRLGILSHDFSNVTGVSSARMSTPYSTAAALVFGSCGLEAFSEEAIGRSQVIDLAKKVRVTENEQLTRACPGRRGAIVTIRLSDGRTFSDEVENPLGEPEKRMSDAQIEEKYMSLMRHSGVPEMELESMKRQIWSLKNSYQQFITRI